MVNHRPDPHLWSIRDRIQIHGQSQTESVINHRPDPYPGWITDRIRNPGQSQTLSRSMVNHRPIRIHGQSQTGSRSMVNHRTDPDLGSIIDGIRIHRQSQTGSGSMVNYRPDPDPWSITDLIHSRGQRVLENKLQFTHSSQQQDNGQTNHYFNEIWDYAMVVKDKLISGKE